MIKEMIPNVRVSNDARELILNCCTGGYRSSNSFTLEHIYNNYHRRWSSYCWVVSATKLPWSHFLPSKSSTVRYSCISKSFCFETLAKHPVHDSDFVLLCIHCLVWWIWHHSPRQWTNQWKRNSEKFQLLVKSFLVVENKIFL